MKPLITPDALHDQLQLPELRIVDVRFDLSDPQAGRAAYAQAHLPGAHYLHLDEHLSSPAQRHGGRHPLPDMARFQEMLEAIGISNSSHVVVYDDSAGMFAGRLWWLLRYVGHDRVQVLDGGLSAWQRAGYPLTAELPEVSRGSFTLNLRPEMQVDMQYVRDNLENPEVLLIDARGRARYRGESEPIDAQAGHIPGALNLPFEDNLAGGSFKSPAALSEQYQAALEAEEVIVYCGSGVSAAHNLMALETIGVSAKLYVGSWSDWSSYPENPVATGDEP
jgi:thiosulfate/3-mercaptopyruvate sulfurtransferase